MVGLFTVATASYLIAITARRLVAQLQGKPVYVVSEVTLVPLSSQVEAQKAIETAVVGRGARHEQESSSDEEEEDEEDGIDGGALQAGDGAVDDRGDGLLEPVDANGRRGGERARRTSIAEDVIGRKGQYGRFAEQWFSNEGWGVDRRRVHGGPVDEDLRMAVAGRKASIERGLADGTSDAKAEDDTKRHVDQRKRNAMTLLPKLLRTARMLLGSSESFYFSYDCDITRRLGSETRSAELPLHKLVDPSVRSAMGDRY